MANGDEGVGGMPPVDHNLRSTKEVGNWMNTKGRLERWEQVDRMIDDLFIKGAQTLGEVHSQGMKVSSQVHQQALETSQRAFELSQKCFGNMHERVSGLDMNEAQARRINAGTTLDQTAMDHGFTSGIVEQIAAAVSTAVGGQLRNLIELLRSPTPAPTGKPGD